MKKIFTIILLIIFSQITGCNSTKKANNPPFKFSDEDIQQGNQKFKRLKKRVGIYNDEKLDAYVTHVGNNVLRAASVPTLNFSFNILDTTLINAHAIQDGHILITKGMLILLEDEAQLASVIAHEVAHIVSGHTADREKRFRDTMKLTKEINRNFDTSGARQVSRLFSTISQKSYLRKNELHADQLAVDYIKNTNYPPIAVLESLYALKKYEAFYRSKTQRESSNNLSHMLSSHPDINKRISTIEPLLSEQKKTTLRYSRKTNEYLSAINGLKLTNKKSKRSLAIIEVTDKKPLIKFFNDLEDDEKKYKELFMLINNLKNLEDLKTPALLKWIKVEPAA